MADIGEAMYHGYIRCATCEDNHKPTQGRIDLSDVETVEEAKERWREHIEEYHPGVLGE